MSSSNLIEVRETIDPCDNSLHVVEVWSDGTRPEYIYSIDYLWDNRNIYPNIRAEYNRQFAITRMQTMSQPIRLI